MAFDRKFLKKVGFTALSLAISAAASPSAWAMCALCKKAAEATNAGFLRGVYWSLILIGGVPIAVFVFMAWTYRRLSRKARSS